MVLKAVDPSRNARQLPRAKREAELKIFVDSPSELCDFTVAP